MRQAILAEAVHLQQKMDLDAEIQKLKEDYPAVNRQFFIVNYELFKREHWQDEKFYPPFLFLFLESLYRQTALFDDEELKLTFKRIGFSDDDLKMFIPVQAIVRELESIKLHSTVFLQHDAFVFSKLFIDQNIRNIVSRWAGYTLSYNGEKNIPGWKVEALNLFKRRGYSGKKTSRKIPLLDLLCDEVFLQPMKNMQLSEKTIKHVFSKMMDSDAYNFCLKEIVRVAC